MAPEPKLVTSIRINAPTLAKASTFSGDTRRIGRLPTNRPTIMPPHSRNKLSRLAAPQVQGGDGTFSSGLAAAKALLDGGLSRPTAILASNDEIATAVVQRCRRTED